MDAYTCIRITPDTRFYMDTVIPRESWRAGWRCAVTSKGQSGSRAITRTATAIVEGPLPGHS